MWVFWLAAAMLAAGAGALVALRAVRAASHAADGADPSLPVYRRHLTELDDLAERGLLAPEEHRAARAEAGRRLLTAADRKGAGEASGGKKARIGVLIGIAGAAVAALAIYTVVGSPGVPDQPYSARIAAWRNGDPKDLDAQKLAAVLVALTRERPNDWRAFAYLGRAQLAAGDAFAAGRALQKAAKLQPQQAEVHSSLGLAFLAQNEGKMTAEADAAFRRAVALDPNDAAARYYLAKARIDAGDKAGGLADWKALATTMSADDPRRGALMAEIERASLPTAPAAAAGGPVIPQEAGEQAAFIRGMVASLAARLKQNPDDAEGWARLVRSYGVLGDRDSQAKALAEARQRFGKNPQALAKIEAEAGTKAIPSQ